MNNSVKYLKSGITIIKKILITSWLLNKEIYEENDCQRLYV